MEFELIERYLQAVGQYLPAKRREDVLAELRANLMARVEDSEQEHGRPLTQMELAEILREHGRPAVVAARYQAQQHLIGPAIFPFYWLAVRKALPPIVLVVAISQALLARDVGAALHGLPLTILVVWAGITLAFAAFEASWTRFGSRLPEWDPRDLPALQRQPQRQSRANRIADAVVSALFVAWLIEAPNQPWLILGPGAALLHGQPLALAPEWRLFYWQIVALLLCRLGLKVVTLFTATRAWHRVLDLAIQGFGIIVLATVIGMRHYFIATGPGQSLLSAYALNRWISLGFHIALAISFASLVWNLWKGRRDGGAVSA
ncbi:hypothetical protein SAMN05421770_101616 [Granulicella rosea]|uniref:Uncharacterized protein n=1 Tax=Granulicella rosea TaxID=474952 RepID=A0A239DU68_9BACT|nr:hypothetical protein [Granulicella rosea]SNS35104.1 hypothetical protein SAMN05421770_101616 [Granulicella rosea]